MNTRFNPTASGPLHLGHLYLAKVNEAVARTTGGRFILRIDDTDPCVCLGVHMDDREKYADAISRELKWAGVVFDDVYVQSYKRDEVLDTMDDLLLPRLNIHVDHNNHSQRTSNPLCVPGCTGNCDFPEIPYETKVEQFNARIAAERVVLDYLDEIDCVIRGDELFGEYALYQYLCFLKGYRLPKHIYLPRLYCDSRSLSKSDGGGELWKLKSAGYSPDELDDLLRESCLVSRDLPWCVENIVACPTLKDGVL